MNMIIRHGNRGCLREGGCSLCKPVRKRDWIDKAGLYLEIDEGYDDWWLVEEESREAVMAVELR